MNVETKVFEKDGLGIWAHAELIDDYVIRAIVSVFDRRVCLEVYGEHGSAEFTGCETAVLTRASQLGRLAGREIEPGMVSEMIRRCRLALAERLLEEFHHQAEMVS